MQKIIYRPVSNHPDITELHCFDLENTVFTVPHSDDEEEIWDAGDTSQPYPFKNWLGQGVDLTKFFAPGPAMENIISSQSKPLTVSFIFTGRQAKLSPSIQKAMENQNIKPNYGFFVPDETAIHKTVDMRAIDVIKMLCQQFPNLKKIEIWDDNTLHVESFKNFANSPFLKGKKIVVDVHLAKPKKK